MTADATSPNKKTVLLILARMIFVERDPRDVCVSYYNFTNGMGQQSKAKQQRIPVQNLNAIAIHTQGGQLQVTGKRMKVVWESAFAFEVNNSNMKL